MGMTPLGEYPLGAIEDLLVKGFMKWGLIKVQSECEEALKEGGGGVGFGESEVGSCEVFVSPVSERGNFEASL